MVRVIPFCRVAVYGACFLLLVSMVYSPLGCRKTDQDNASVCTQYRLKCLGEAAITLAQMGEKPDQCKDVEDFVRLALSKQVLYQTTVGMDADFSRDAWGEQFGWAICTDADSGIATIKVETSRKTKAKRFAILVKLDNNKREYSWKQLE